MQKALRDAGIIDELNIGNNYISNEWIEKEANIRLRCLGLDDNGVIMVNGKEAGRFNNTFIPYNFDLTTCLKEKDNTLAIVFECPPSYLGQIGYTSKIRDWKPRFYYGWDWIPRIVQIGIWDDVFLEVLDKDHSEVGVAGAMSAAIINKYRGEFPALPANMDNPLWRQVSWWIEWSDFLNDTNGKEPLSLEEYVVWSQERQTTGLSIALQANKSRFPECRGFIIWMGHDSYPCPVNTSIIDFDGNPKPVAKKLSQIWKVDK